MPSGGGIITSLTFIQEMRHTHTHTHYVCIYVCVCMYNFLNEMKTESKSCCFIHTQTCTHITRKQYNRKLPLRKQHTIAKYEHYVLFTHLQGDCNTIQQKKNVYFWEIKIFITGSNLQGKKVFNFFYLSFKHKQAFNQTNISAKDHKSQQTQRRVNYFFLNSTFCHQHSRPCTNCTSFCHSHLFPPSL